MEKSDRGEIASVQWLNAHSACKRCQVQTLPSPCIARRFLDCCVDSMDLFLFILLLTRKHHYHIFRYYLPKWRLYCFRSSFRGKRMSRQYSQVNSLSACIAVLMSALGTYRTVKNQGIILRWSSDFVWATGMGYEEMNEPQNWPLNQLIFHPLKLPVCRIIVLTLFGSQYFSPCEVNGRIPEHQ